MFVNGFVYTRTHITLSTYDLSLTNYPHPFVQQFYRSPKVTTHAELSPD